MHTEEWYLTRNVAALTAAERTTIEEEFREVTGNAFAESFSLNCPDRYRDAITIILKTMKNEKGAEGYVLKAGIVFKYKGRWITCDNITSAAAEWWIEQDLQHRDDFHELARDYDSYEKKGAIKE